MVGDLGVQAEAQYLSCNLRGVKQPVFEAVEQSLQYRTFVVLPMGDMKRSFFAEINMHQFESQFRFVYVGVMEQGVLKDRKRAFKRGAHLQACGVA